LQSAGKNVIIKHREYLFSRYIMPPKDPDFSPPNFARDFLNLIKPDKLNEKQTLISHIKEIRNDINQRIIHDAASADDGHGVWCDSEIDQARFFSALLETACDDIVNANEVGKARQVLRQFRHIMEDGFDIDNMPITNSKSVQAIYEDLLAWVHNSQIESQNKNSITSDLNGALNKYSANFANIDRVLEGNGLAEEDKHDLVGYYSRKFKEVEAHPPHLYDNVFHKLVGKYLSGKNDEGFPTEKLLQLIGEKKSRVEAAAGPVLQEILGGAAPRDGENRVIVDLMDSKAIGTLIKIAKEYPNSAFNQDLKGFLASGEEVEHNLLLEARKAKMEEQDLKELREGFKALAPNHWEEGPFADQLKEFIKRNDGERFFTPSEVDHFIVATNDYLGKREPFPGFDPRKSLPWAGRALARTVINSFPLIGKRSKIYASSGNNPNYFIRKFNEIFRGEVYLEHNWGDQPIASDLVYLYESGVIPETQLKEYLDLLSERDGSYFANALANRGGIKGWELDNSIIPIKRRFSPSPAKAVMKRLLSKKHIDNGDSAAVKSLTEAMAKRSASPINSLFGKGKLRGIEKELAEYVEKLAYQSDDTKRGNELKELMKSLSIDTNVFAQVSAAAAFAITRKSGGRFRDALKSITEYNELSMSQLAVINDILAEKLVNITSEIDSAPNKKTREGLQKKAKALRTMLKDFDDLRVEKTKGIDIFKNRQEQLALGALLIVVGGPFAVIGFAMVIDAAYNGASISVRKYMNSLIGKAKEKDANNEKETLELGYDAGLISIAAGLLIALIKGIEIGIRKLAGEDVDMRSALRKGVDVANGLYGFSLLSLIEAALSLAFLPVTAVYNRYNKPEWDNPRQIPSNQDARRDPDPRDRATAALERPRSKSSPNIFAPPAAPNPAAAKPAPSADPSPAAAKPVPPADPNPATAKPVPPAKPKKEPEKGRFLDLEETYSVDGPPTPPTIPAGAPIGRKR
jgi:hypothetical protein